MKKYTSVILSFVMAVLVSFSAGAASPSATTILNKVIATIESAPSLTLELSTSVGSTAHSAQLVVDRERFKFSGADMMVFYDGTTQWTYQPSAREVTLTTPTATELTEINPLAFVRNYQTNYNVGLKTSGKGSYVVTMNAKKKGLYVKTAEVTVNSTTWMPTHVTATLSNGQKMTVIVKSVNRGKKHAIDFFRFNKASFPGVEIIDLR